METIKKYTYQNMASRETSLGYVAQRNHIYPPSIW